MTTLTETTPTQGRHTAGPWTMDRHEQLRSPDGVQVGVWGAGIAWVSRSPEAEANARLIAAAPDLLEACENFKGLYDTPAERRRRGDDPFYAEAVEHLREAIARAQGGAA